MHHFQVSRNRESSLTRINPNYNQAAADSTQSHNRQSDPQLQCQQQTPCHDGVWIPPWLDEAQNTIDTTAASTSYGPPAPPVPFSWFNPWSYHAAPPAQPQQQQHEENPLATGDRILFPPVPATYAGEESYSRVASQPTFCNYHSSVPPLPVPQPSAAYIEQASLEPWKRPTAQTLLVIVDLNGTLLHRPKSRDRGMIICRPFCTPFLQYLLENHYVMVWSSARPENVNRMVNKVFTAKQRRHLVAIWARDKLGLTSVQYNNKVQVYKKLFTIWNCASIARSHPEYSAGGRWGQSNTILLDDSSLKASSEPWNLVQIPEFKYIEGQESDDMALKQVEIYLDLASQWGDVSGFIKKYPFSERRDWENGVDDDDSAFWNRLTCDIL